MTRLTEDDPLTSVILDEPFDSDFFGTEEEEIQIAKGLGLCRKCGGDVPSIFGRFRINQLCDECNCEIDTSESFGLGIRLN